MEAKINIIDTSIRPASTTWAAGLLIMNGGLFLIPIIGTFLFGVLPLMSSNALTTAIVLAGFGGALLFAAWAAFRGADWPRYFLIVVAAAELTGLVLGYAYLFAALLFLGTALWLLWRPSARKFAAEASETTANPRRQARE